MLRNDWAPALKELIDLVGKPEAKRLLVVEKVSPGTADKIVGGRYPSNPGHLVTAAILRAREAAKSKVA